jgi:hypothetical protein
MSRTRPDCRLAESERPVTLQPQGGNGGRCELLAPNHWHRGAHPLPPIPFRTGNLITNRRSFSRRRRGPWPGGPPYMVLVHTHLDSGKRPGLVRHRPRTKRAAGRKIPYQSSVQCFVACASPPPEVPCTRGLWDYMYTCTSASSRKRHTNSRQSEVLPVPSTTLSVGRPSSANWEMGHWRIGFTTNIRYRDPADVEGSMVCYLSCLEKRCRSRAQRLAFRARCRTEAWNDQKPSSTSPT